MAQNDRGTIGLVKIATPALTIGGISESSIDPNLEEMIAGGSGEVDPTMTAGMRGRPMIGFSTRALATVLASCGIAGCQVTTLDTYLHKIAAFGTRSAGATHDKVSIASGLLVPRTIEVAHGDPEGARLSLEAWSISSDGVTAPIEFTATQAIPAGGGVAEAFTIGPVSINGAALDVASVSVDFGLDVRSEGSEGEVWDKLVYIMSRRPSIRITTPHRLAISDFGIAGTPQGATDSLIYFRKMAAGGTRVIDGTAEHISIAIDDGRIVCGPVSGSHGETLGTEVIINPVYDGTNAILVIDPACVIT